MSAHKHGCFDRKPFTEAQTIGTEYAMVMGLLVKRAVQIPNFSAADSSCRYTLSALGQADASCQGCKWRGP